MTNVVEFEAKTTGERQAREWLIRLDGDAPLTGEELAALREWMARNPAHGEELRRLSRFWKQANILTELAVPLGRKDTVRRSAFRQPALLAVMSVSAVSILMLAWWMLRPEGVANGTYGTVIGQQRTLGLSDGSSIELNTDSQVQVLYSDRSRQVRLLRGEALFSVAHDRSKAFEVYAANGVVRAVGTAFAVQLDDGGVKVTVTQGIVALAELASPPHMQREARTLARLAAGESTLFANGSQSLDVQRLPPAELERRLAWHDGYLVFTGEPLSEVVEQINRYSPVTVQLADPGLASIAVGGRFKVGDLEAILAALQANFGIHARQINERLIQLEPASPSSAM